MFFTRFDIIKISWDEISCIKGAFNIINLQTLKNNFKNTKQVERNLFVVSAASVFLPYSICLIVFFATFTVYLFNHKLDIKAFMPDHSAWFYIFFLTTMVTTMAFYRWFGVVIVILIFMLALFGFILQREMTEYLAKNMITTMAYMSIIAATAALLQKIPVITYRSVSFFANANYYAYICETFIIALIYAIYKFGNKPVFYIAVVSNIIGIASSGCRTAWIAILVGIIALLICLKKYLHLIIFSSAAAVCGILVSLFPLVFFPRHTDFGSDSSLRYLIWKTSIGFFKQYPIFGQGMLSYYSLSKGRPHDLHSHNLILDILLNYGVIGSLLLTVFVVFLVIAAIKHLKARPIGAISVAVIFATLAHGFTDIPFFGLTTFSILIIFLSFAGFNNRLLPKKAK